MSDKTDMREIFAEIVELNSFEEACKLTGMNDLKCFFDSELTTDDIAMLKDVFNGLCEQINSYESQIRDYKANLNRNEPDVITLEVPIIKDGMTETLFNDHIQEFVRDNNLQTSDAYVLNSGYDLLEQYTFDC